MRRDLFVYLSGPMTAQPDFSMERNTADGVDAYLACLRAGIPAFSPHLAGAFPSAWSALTHAEWLEYDYGIIDRCTHVVMLPRWETSTGALAERAYAESVGVPVVEGFDALIAAVQV